MRAEVKAVSSPDIFDLPNYLPENPICFSFPLELLIGAFNQKGGEIFQLTVCTPQWLVENHIAEDIILGRHLLIVFEYNYERILQRVDKYMQHCTGQTWGEVALKVGRLALWEFEDYIPQSN